MGKSGETSRIQSFHGLRGIMAWWVVAGHVSLALAWKLPLIDRNTLAVDVFILLSGFVIAMLIDRKDEAYPAYIVRRAFRLFPLYLPVLAISTLLLGVQAEAWASLPPTDANLNRMALAEQAIKALPSHLFIHVPLLQGLVPLSFADNPAYTIVGQAWSISLEWQFYLVAPFLVGAMLRQRWLVAAAIVGGLLALAPLFTGAFLGAKILLFAIGIATHVSTKPGASGASAVIGLICALGAIAVDGFAQLIPLLLWAAVVFSSRQPTKSVFHLPARLLGARIPSHMGDISYSIYLLHMIPLYGIAYLCAAFGLAGMPAQVAIAVGTIVLTYLGSLATYAAIEKPGIAAGARVARGRAGTAPSV